MRRLLEITIDAPPERAWHILAERFTAIADWTDAVERSWPMTADDAPDALTVAPTAPVPGRWVVTPLGEFGEALTAWSDTERSFTFEAFDTLPILTRSSNRTTVHAEEPHRCRVTLDVEMRLWGPLRLFEPILERRIGKALGPLLTDLKRAAEADDQTEEQAA